MERLIELTRLLDFYGVLLTERQRSLMVQYAYEDCSLGEIAERESISRQAVRDALVCGESALRMYEEKLHLIASNDAIERACTDLAERITGLSLPEAERRLMLDRIQVIRSAMEDNDGV